MRNMLIILILAGSLASCCGAAAGSNQHDAVERLTSIGRELDGDDKLKGLHVLVDKLSNPNRYCPDLWHKVIYKDLAICLKETNNEGHPVQAVLEQCQLVYDQMKEVAPEVLVWGGSSSSWNEETKKWVAHYNVCKELVGQPKGLGKQILFEWDLLNSVVDSSLKTFADHLTGLPEEVALSKSAEISDELVADKVVKYIENRMRSSADGIPMPKESKERQERFEKLLGRLKYSCSQVSDYFRHYIWALDAGVKLDKSNVGLYAKVVSAVKVERVCARLQSIDFNEAISQWLDQPEDYWKDQSKDQLNDQSNNQAKDQSKNQPKNQPKIQPKNQSSLLHNIKKIIACGSGKPTAE